MKKGPAVLIIVGLSVVCLALIAGLFLSQPEVKTGQKYKGLDHCDKAFKNQEVGPDFEASERNEDPDLDLDLTASLRVGVGPEGYCVDLFAEFYEEDWVIDSSIIYVELDDARYENERYTLQESGAASEVLFAPLEGCVSVYGRLDLVKNPRIANSSRYGPNPEYASWEARENYGDCENKPGFILD